MAIRPDYDIGTVTLTSGSSDFTTSGSSLLTAAVQAGDAIIAPSGHVLIIASITGQNSGTLFLPCPPDAAGTGLPLRIRFQPDGSRYQGAVRNLIDLLSSGNLEAFAALVGAAGMVPIFTGPGTLDLADPATFGIQDPNGSLGKLAEKVFTSDAGFLTLVGSFVTKATSGIEVENSVMAYDTPTAVIHGYKANGTEEAPTAVVSGQLVYGIGSRPYDGSGWTAHSTAAFHFIATENFTATNHGTALRILVTPKGTTQENRKQAISFESDGASLGIRYKIPSSGDVNGRAYFQDANGGNTALGVLGGGSGKNATLNLFYAGDPANAALFQLGIDADSSFISSANTGAGSVRPLAFKVGGVERARIPTDGNLYVNCESVLNAGGATPGVVTIRHKPGAAHALRIDNPDASGGVVVFVTSAGGAGGITVNGTSTSYNTSSDYRLKPIVETLVTFELNAEQFDCLDNALLRVLAWRPIRHNWINEPDVFTHGFLAHELQAVSPHAVTGEKDGIEEIGTAVISGEIIPALEKIELQEVDGKTVEVTVTEPERQLPDQVIENVTKAQFPDAKSWTKTGERPVYQGVDTSKLVPDLAAAIQSLTLMVLEQREQIAALETDVARLQV